MLIGIPKEIKDFEDRVALTPLGAKELVDARHEVMIQKDAGKNIGYFNEDYLNCGANILDTATEIFKKAELIVKVKEPLAEEIKLLKAKQILFSYLHLVSLQDSANIIDTGVTSIAFETITDNYGFLPLLSPMSEIAGKVAVQTGAYLLQRNFSGKGILLSSIPGVDKANVVIIGGGVAGKNAANVAYGMGANVTILDNSMTRLRQLEDIFGQNINLLYSSKTNLEHQLKTADLVIGAVLIPGASAPKVITKKMLKNMVERSVIIDIAIDQGGCFETSKPTTHSNPTYIEEEIIHYCVTNMPAVAARTATKSLENSTLPYILKIANLGCKKALLSDPHLRNGLNIYDKKITHENVAKSLNLEYYDSVNLLQ